MNQIEKETHFREFIKKWENEFIKIPYILQYMNSYSEVTNKIKDTPNVNFEELCKRQIEWVSLISQFDNKTDKRFFKNYWVPIQSMEYDFFIDLSKNKYRIFKANYFVYKWSKDYITGDLSDFLLKFDQQEFDIEKILNLSKERFNRKMMFWAKTTNEGDLPDAFKNRD